MPSDQRIDACLEALAPQCAAFRSAVAQTADQVRALIERLGPPADGNGDASAPAADDLGAFGRARLDSGRFAALFDERQQVDATAARVLDKALQLLSGALHSGDHLFFAPMHPHGELRETVRRTLSGAGRAFGAAHAVDLVKAGRATDAIVPLGSYPPERWNSRERMLAPPVVVQLNGEDLHVGGLESFLAGAQKVVLVIDGAAPPAALVRLVTPGVFVMQCEDPAELGRLASVPGPAIATLGADTALFVHEPTVAGAQGTLTVTRMPDADARGPYSGARAFQHADELRQLAVLAKALTTRDDDAAAAAAPADMLAAWLLRQSEVAAAVGG